VLIGCWKLWATQYRKAIHGYEMEDLMKLYRIVSLETFIDLLHNKRERYARPACWEDTFEGYLFAKLYDEKEQKRIIKEMYDKVCPRDYILTIDNVLKLEHAKYFIYGQCWSENVDSDAMWRIYSYGNHSIQIESTIEKLDQMLFKNGWLNHRIAKVDYDVESEDKLVYKQILQLKESLSTYAPFLHKRKAFEHEREVRVLIDGWDSYEMTKESIRGAKWGIEQSMDKLSTDEEKIEEITKRLEANLNKWNEKAIPNDIYVNNINLHDYIIGVTVNPLAEEWYSELVGSLCKQAGIAFNGKSKLYQSV
jgi:hypothetical protein